jgi:hypothetical protein
MPSGSKVKTAKAGLKEKEGKESIESIEMLEILEILEMLEILYKPATPQPLPYPENCTKTCFAFKPLTRAHVLILYCAYFNIII